MRIGQGLIFPLGNACNISSHIVTCEDLEGLVEQCTVVIMLLVYQWSSATVPNNNSPSAPPCHSVAQTLWAGINKQMFTIDKEYELLTVLASLATQSPV